MKHLLAEVRLAGRVLRASPGYSAAAILTMAVALGATTAIFSVFDRLVLHPVSMPDPASLVAIWFNSPPRNVQVQAISVPRYDELAARVSSFSSIALSGAGHFYPDRQRRSGAAERPARQRLVPADARRAAGARPQLPAVGRCRPTDRRSASSATSSGRRGSAAATMCSAARFSSMAAPGRSSASCPRRSPRPSDRSRSLRRGSPTSVS